MAPDKPKPQAEIDRLRAVNAELIAALAEIAAPRTSHLRSNQMQAAINMHKAIARAALAKARG